MSVENKPPDNWDATLYNQSLSHIPTLAHEVLALTTPTPNASILDIGCGNGVLAAQLAQKAPQGRILGLDSSTSMITAAQQTYPASSHPQLRFALHDCSQLASRPSQLAPDEPWEASWDWIFSNSALHWLLRGEETREKLFADAYALLRSGGHFVFEFGGAGHVAEAVTALMAMLAHHGIPPARRRELSPWFFPSEAWMRDVLERNGFEVVSAETKLRPTKLDVEKGELEGWVRVLGYVFLDEIAPAGDPKREDAVRWVVQVLRDACERIEDGCVYLNYVRLRMLARKKG